MRTDCFSEEAVKEAYASFDFAVSPLGAGLSMSVECDTGLPVSTPAEKREKLFQAELKKSQTKANKIADRQRKVAEALAKKVTHKMQKELRAKK
jgi:cytochrome c-type biogenesis protein CcmH/NrfF